MKKVVIIFLLLSILSTITKASERIKERIVVEITMLGHYAIANNEFFLLELRVINSSDSSLNFWAYNCAYLFNLTINSKDFELVGNVCDSNYPQLNVIEPKHSVSYPIVLTKKYKKSNNNAFRLGFVFVNQEQHSFGSDLMEAIVKIRDLGNQTYWSNEIDILKNRTNLPIIHPTGADMLSEPLYHPR